MIDKEIKQKIKALKKLKKQMRAGSKERLQAHREIKTLQAQLDAKNVIDLDKQALIEQIKKLDSYFDKLAINLNKFSIKELTFHLNKIKKEIK